MDRASVARRSSLVVRTSVAVRGNRSKKKRLCVPSSRHVLDLVAGPICWTRGWRAVSGIDVRAYHDVRTVRYVTCRIGPAFVARRFCVRWTAAGTGSPCCGRTALRDKSKRTACARWVITLLDARYRSDHVAFLRECFFGHAT